MGSRHDKPNGRCRRPADARVCLRKGWRWTEVPAAALESALLPRPRMPAFGEALAGGEAGRPKRRQDEAVKFQHAEAERARRQRSTTPLCHTKRRSRLRLGRRVVTQQKFFRRRRCVIGRGAMSRLRSRAAARHATAAMRAVRRFAAYVIVNASGCCVARSEAAARASRSTRPPARDAANSNPKPSTRRRHRRRLHDPDLQVAPVRS